MNELRLLVGAPAFNDEVLSALVDVALNFNADLQGAVLRVEPVAGDLKVASVSLLPTLSVRHQQRRLVQQHQRLERPVAE